MWRLIKTWIKQAGKKTSLDVVVKSFKMGDGGPFGRETHAYRSIDEARTMRWEGETTELTSNVED